MPPNLNGMKRYFFVILFLFIQNVLFSQNSVTQYVNPFVGTDFTGHTYPGALLPFGGVQASPDTRLDGWQGCSAYHYSDSIVYGFSHTHLSGTGCSDYGDILLMPFTGKPSVINTEYASPFSHKNESASPGYYSVLLDKYGVKVELTTTLRVAMHRYTFPNDNQPKGVIVDLQHRDMVLRSALRYDSEKKALLGNRDSKAWNPDQRLDFSILFSDAIEKIEYYQDNKLVDSVSGIEGKNCKAIVYFYPDVKEIVLKVAISGVALGMDEAHVNHKEIPDFNFDKVKANANEIWNGELGKIEVETDDEEQKRVFYTALYHCFTSPYIFTDVLGRYRGMDGKVHHAKGHDVYTVFSLWDTYRALHPLLALIDRERTEDFLYTFAKHYEQGNMLPMWELSAHETWCMIGYHSIPVILDAYRKGISIENPEMMLKAMVESAKLDKLGRRPYEKFGYVPADKEHESVSKTLEYAYDDWCIAQMAKDLGNNEIYEEFIRRSQYYKNIMDPQGFMHARGNGALLYPFDPTEVNNHFTEANSWQYSTYVPHDFYNYVHLIGGEKVAEKFLDSLFQTKAKLSGRDQVDVTGLIGQYAHGNEPSHHAAYLYNYLAKPHKTQELVRKIMSELYTSKPDGLCGNEDCGQMSAWYVMSAMGFYPVCPGDNMYAIGSPIFDKVTIHLENGMDLVIECKNQSATNRYIKSCMLNGKKHSRNYLTFDDIKDGGLIQFVMSPKPEKWGAKTENCPLSFVNATMTMTPRFSTEQRSFKDSMKVELFGYQPAEMDNPKTKYPAQTDKIYYTLDGSEPTLSSQLYTKPISITKDVTIKAVAWNPETGFSNVVTADYVQFQRDKQIQLITPYSPQYPAGGDLGLIDGIRGTVNYKLGGWQGYTDDFEAIVDLEKMREISTVKVGFLQEIRSWIWYPSEMIVQVSEDGKTWTNYGIFKNPHSVMDEETEIDNFTIQKNVHTRYVKIYAKNFGIIPDWHLGAGSKAWIFIDEITIY